MRHFAPKSMLTLSSLSVLALCALQAKAEEAPYNLLVLQLAQASPARPQERLRTHRQPVPLLHRAMLTPCNST